MKEAIVKEIEDLVRLVVSSRESDLKVIEDGLKGKGNKLLLKVLKEGLRESDAGYEEVRCRICGQGATRLGQRPKRVHLTLGEVEMKRSCYWCRKCSLTWAPLDSQFGIDQSGRSPRLVEAMALLGCEFPFRAAAERLAQLCGVEVCPSQVEAVSEGVGKSLEAGGNGGGL